MYFKLKRFIALVVLVTVSLVIHAQNFTPGNLTVLVAASATGNNTTASVVEINTTSASQSAITTTAIDGATVPNAMRFSGSATSTMYAATSDDGSLLCFSGHNSTNTASNANTLTTHAVVTLNASRTVSLAATYTGVSGNQTRCATTLNNTNFFVGAQNGFYTNGATAVSPSGNVRSVKSFGGVVYVNTTTSPFVGTLSSPSGASVTALSFATAPASQPYDIYLISSGSNGSTFDVMYTIVSTGATAGTIAKYSLVSGQWVSNGTYTTTFGGYTITAKKSGTGAELYAVTGTGATAANSVIKLTDTAGHNATLSITTANNVTLYTTAAGTTIKGIAFAPVAPNAAVTLSSPSQVSSVDIAQGAVNQTISSFQAAVANSNATLSSLAFTTEGTYASSDVVNFKLYYNSSANSYPSGAVQIGTTQSAANSGSTVTFSSLNTTINNATTGYFFITASISSSATAGNTINVAANPVLTFTSGTQSGTISAGGVQTVITAEPTIVISNGTIASANAAQNTTNVLLYRADIAVSVTGTSLNAATFTTAGTYVASDITNLKLWYSTNSTFSAGTATLLNTKTTGLAPGNQVFGAGGQALSSGVTSYIYVTADLNCTSTIGSTINVNAISSASSFVFGSGTPTGSGFTAGGAQTFTAGVSTPANVTTQLGYGNGTSGSISVSWVAPTGCSNEIMIVAAPATNTGTPSGDGSAYTANSAYTLGTAIGNGFVVYKGSASSSPQAFNGFTNGTNYYFKIYTRYNSSWSTGVEVNSAAFTNITCTDVIVPQYMQGLNGTNSNRVPTAFRVTLSGLTANTTYRYINQAVIATDLPNSGGAGNPIFVNTSGNFFGSASPSLATPGTSCGTFTTDGTGAYTGWFALEPTGNATRFVPGNTVYMRFAINDGATGTTAIYRATTTNGMIVKNLGTTSTDATGIRGTSSASPRDFICLYGNTSGSGRPISTTYVESDGYGNTASYAAFYYVAGSSPVEGVNGAWGAIVPNALPSGVRRIESRSLTSGEVICAYYGDGLGVWGATNTVDPIGGTTPLVIASADAPMNCSSVTLDHTGISQVSSSEISVGSNDNLLSNFHLSNTKNTTSLTGISFNTIGTFVAGDISAFKLYTATTPSFASATLLSTVSATALSATDAVNFAFTQSIAIGDRYFWITADLTSAGSGRTVRVPALLNAAFTFAANADIALNTIDFGGLMTIGTPVPTVAISDATMTVGNLATGTNNNVIQAARIDVGVTSATFTDLTFNTTGSYVNGDLNNFKLYYQGTSSFNPATATLLGTIATALTTGGHTFSGFSQSIPVGSAYVFITTDLPCAATLGGDLSVSTLLGAGFGVSSTSASGSATEKGPFIITAGLPSNVTGASATATGANGTVALNWTMPVGCYDQIVIVAAPAANTGTPSGDGSAYTSNTIYGNGTALGNGFVVYAGSASTQNITGMTNGTNYFFKMFTRNGSNWSSGVEVSATPVLIAAFTDAIIPQYIQGLNGTNSNRLPFAYRGTISNLLPNATYRYYNSVVLTTATATDNGAGNTIFTSSTGSWVRSSAPSLSTAGGYGTFTTDSNGSYTGWFITEPTGNATRFVPGLQLKGRIMLNDGNNGTAIASRVTTTSTFTVINTVASAGANNGTVLVSNSTFATPKNFVALYDNEAGTGRPLSMTFVENDGTANSAVNSYNASYASSVDGITGSWGAIIPNTLTNGVRRIEQLDFTTGLVVGCTATDTDGTWGLVNTVNPSSGPTALSILAADAPLFPSTPTWYIDADSDGHYIPGTGVTQCSSPGANYNPAATVSGDCDDNNATIFDEVSLYVDADGDGRTVGSASTLCIGASIPSGYSATSLGTDCDDADIAVWQSGTFYTDTDSDGYHGSSAVICYGATTPAGSTTTLGLDCNDSNASISPGNVEVCDNLLDDDCDGGVDEYCSSLVGNDSPSYASLVQYSVNSAYPNCYPIAGNLSGATDSPQSATFTGPDQWYRFVAQSTGVSVTLSSTANDDVIELYQKVGSSYVLLSGGTENATSAASDFERLNYSGLTPGQTYYVSVGAAAGSTGGAYSLCIQHLMPSGCAYVQPASGFALCSSYKAIYRGSISSGVSYAFNFQGVGGGASSSTSLSGTNGLIVLSNPTLALRYGGIYDVRVDVNYALTNGAGTAEPIVVQGSISSANCNDVTIASQPLMEVRNSQRCPATLLRSNWLIANPVGSTSNACGAINYTFEFTQVVSCTDLTSVSVLPAEYTTGGNTPYLGLGVLPSLAQTGAWKVRVRPNFSYGAGLYGPVQTIQVANTAASGMLDGSEWNESQERMDIIAMEDMIYPNPSHGDAVRVQFMNLQSEQVRVRVIDAMGREVYAMSYSVDGSLNTTLDFQEALASGVYTVQLQDGAETRTERLVVSK
jgi:hypothetical protein